MPHLLWQKQVPIKPFVTQKSYRNCAFLSQHQCTHDFLSSEPFFFYCLPVVPFFKASRVPRRNQGARLQQFQKYLLLDILSLLEMLSFCLFALCCILNFGSQYTMQGLRLCCVRNSFSCWDFHWSYCNKFPEDYVSLDTKNTLTSVF